MRIRGCFSLVSFLPYSRMSFDTTIRKFRYPPPMLWLYLSLPLSHIEDERKLATATLGWTTSTRIIIESSMLPPRPLCPYFSFLILPHRLKWTSNTTHSIDFTAGIHMDAMCARLGENPGIELYTSGGNAFVVRAPLCEYHTHECPRRSGPFMRH